MQPDGAAVPPWSLALEPASSPHPVDIHVGGRLRLARTAREVSQQALGAVVAVSAQQIQKYESGANRISASTLFRLGGFLGRPPDWFFEGLPPTGPADGAPAVPEGMGALLGSREGAQMALAMARLPPPMRRKVLAVIKAFLPDEGAAFVA